MITIQSVDYLILLLATLFLTDKSAVIVLRYLTETSSQGGQNMRGDDRALVHAGWLRLRQPSVHWEHTLSHTQCYTVMLSLTYGHQTPPHHLLNATLHHKP